MQLFLLLSAVLLCVTSAFAPGTGAPTFTRSQLDTRRYNLFDTIGSVVNNFGKKATASHILIGPATLEEDEAKARLLELKEEIGDDPVKFAEAATENSTCPSSKKGGDLGSFFPGMMVKEFDKVCFEEDVGVVHGPISTQFGEHLILVTERTGDKK
jgi:peptidyl-prolyl cis-trans isomerase C